MKSRGTIHMSEDKTNSVSATASVPMQLTEAEAARQLTRIYMSANDAENSYFWGLRCIGDCRGYQHRNHMEDIARDFSAGDIKRIQAAATDSSKLKVTF